MVADTLKFKNPGVQSRPTCFMCGTQADSHVLQPGVATIFGVALPAITVDNRPAGVSMVICNNCLHLLRNCLLTFATHVVATHQAQQQIPPQGEQAEAPAPDDTKSTIIKFPGKGNK